MKAVPIVLGVVLTSVVITSPRAHAAGFVNLNFEQAMIPPGTPPGGIAASLAFPGWTPRIGDTVISTVGYNAGLLTDAYIMLYDRPVSGTPAVVYEGLYSALLSGSRGPDLSSASLSQVGDVPANAQSIRFLADLDGTPELLLGGNVIPLVRLVPHFPPVPTEWGGDITAFSGQTLELRLIANANRIGAVDFVHFSTIAIPEPETLAMAGVLCCCLWRRTRPY